MWAIEVDNSSGNTRLYKGNKAIPAILPDEILIKTYAAGINRADILQKRGLYPPPSDAPDTLGLEISGIVKKTGDNVSIYKPGDKVCALLEGGGYAEYAKVRASQALLLPKNFDLIAGAALPEALFTVYSNFFYHANLKNGASILMHGGASGIGTFAIQIANAYGINCYTTAGSAEKCKILEGLGAKFAINYKVEDFVERIREDTGDVGVNCVVDIVGGTYFNRNLRVLAHGGTLLCLSFLESANITANIAPLIFRNLTVTGTTLRNKTSEQKALIASDLKKYIWPLLENGTIKPVIDSVFDFNNIEDSHQRMESGMHTGKIILKCH